MAIGKYLAAALLASVAVPASASVLVIGNSSARQCYEAADSTIPPTATDIATCDSALRDDALNTHDTVATYVNRGILRLRRNYVDLAIADFDRAIGLDPRQPEAYLNKGAALMRLNDADHALQLFTAALDRNTARPELAHFGRAIAYETLGNVRQAYEDYREASELSPDWQQARTELARFHVVPN